MVLLVTTPTIVAALQDLSPSARDELQLPQPPPEIGSPISHENVLALARALSSHTEPTTSPSYTLNTLLRGTEVYIPPAPAKPEPTPEYLALKARLQTLADEQAYNRLLSPPRANTYAPSPVFAPSTEELLHQAEEAADNDPLSPSLVLNIFMSVLLCGFATFWALKNFQTPSFFRFGHNNKPVAGTTTQVGPNSKEPVFVLISLFVGLVVGVAEVAVYAAYWRKVREAKAKEKGIKERKEIIQPTEDSQDGPVDRGDGEKEEIWGKGVNGGVRRRVRERWE
ncbi:endoplasmic reticulum-based factor for assembly of V-ATPase-domain-containing protein, partial [Talaromyces proteolyticus]